MKINYYIMRICINAENLAGTINLRLKNNGNWEQCNNVRQVNQDDLYSESPSNINNIQTNTFDINYNGITYKMIIYGRNEENDSDAVFLVTHPFEKDYGIDCLYFQAYCFLESEDYRTPTLAQLQETLINGDDNVSNALILMSDGLFSLIPLTEINLEISDARIVVRFESFIEGNGYVGPTIINNNFLGYSSSIYNAAIEHWNIFLETHKLDAYTDNF